jgi:hypothetical protein
MKFARGFLSAQLANIVATAKARSASLAPPQDGWYHLAPFGDFPGSATLKNGDVVDCIHRCDRESFDSIISTFQEHSAKMRANDPNWKGLNVDADHLSYRKDNKTERFAWMTDLKIVGTGANRADGLWCKLELTDLGTPAVSGGIYSFLSAVPLLKKISEKVFGWVALAGTVETPRAEGDSANEAAAAFTNDPCLPVRAFCRADQFARGLLSATASNEAGGKQNDPAVSAGKGQKTMTPEAMKALLLKLLGLPATASDQEIQAACDNTPEASAMESVKAKCRALENEVAELKLGKEADAFCDEHKDKIADRAKLRAAYIKDPAAAKEFFANVKLAPAARSYNRAQTPDGKSVAASDDARERGRQQADAIAKVSKDEGLKGSRAFARARELNPALFAETNKAE